MVVSDEESRRLVENNMKFAYKIVEKEFGKYPYYIKQELNAAALEGLIYAATKYDPENKDENGKTCGFISYAVHWIRYYIYEQIRDFYPVKFNQNFVSKRNKVMKCIEEYKKNNDDKMPTVEYISGIVHMSEKVVKNILSVNNGENFTFMSFNAPAEGEDSTSENLSESKLVDQYLENSADNGFMHKIILDDVLENLQKEITPTEYAIFMDYYIRGESLSDLAKKYDMKFPSSVAYLIKKCEKKCKEIANS